MSEGSLKLHLYSGIPVLALEGEWSEQLQTALRDMIHELTQAAHFEVIVNLSSAYHLPLAETGWWREIEQLGSLLRSHYGRLNLVVTRETMRSAAWRHISPCCGWAFTEEQAVCYIKGLLRCASDQIVSGRLYSGGKRAGHLLSRSRRIVKNEYRRDHS